MKNKLDPYYVFLGILLASIILVMIMSSKTKEPTYRTVPFYQDEQPKDTLSSTNTSFNDSWWAFIL